MDNNKDFSVNVAPEMQLYKVLQRQSYGIDTALAEFVDNSIQSFKDNEARIKKYDGDDAKLVIKISVDSKKNTITIEDNAFGIKRKDFRRAMSLGNKTGYTHNAESLSVYGIGLKSSAIWFSNSWSIETTSLISNEKLIANFNLNNLIQTGNKKIDVKSRSSTKNKHYTKITLKNCIRDLKNKKDSFQDEVLPYLQETFYKFDFLCISIEYDSELLVSNKAFLKEPNPLKFPVVDTKNLPINDEYKIWKLPIDFTLDKKKVKGFMMIMDPGGYKQPGIRLIRNNRVIIGTQGGNRQNRPEYLLKTANKYAAQRIYGELHLDKFDVNFMKTNFDEDLTELYEKIHDLLKGDGNKDDFIRQTTYFRKNKVKKDEADDNDDSEQQEQQTTDNSEAVQDTVRENSDSENKQNAESSEKSQNDNSNKSTSVKNTSLNRIEKSEEIIERLHKAKSAKLENLYNSLCTISLNEHSALSYVGAWSFLESICHLHCEVTNSKFNDFQAYITTRVKKWSDIKPNFRSSIRKALQNIADYGNSAKHDHVHYPENAKQLSIDFKTLEKVFLNLMDEIIQNQ